jgi:Phosphatidylglycerophosphatase A.
MIKKFNSLFVTMFGIGNIKIFPGTFGSLLTVIILYILFHTLNISSYVILVGLIIIFIYSFFAITGYIKI